jgi:hypothetical protein
MPETQVLALDSFSLLKPGAAIVRESKIATYAGGVIFLPRLTSE